jgi:proteasome lid subunit RPN8/RPN11
VGRSPIKSAPPYITMPTKLKIQMGAGHFSEPPSSRIPYASALRWRPRGDRRNRAAPAVDVFFSQKAYLEACNSASSDMENEVGGWLIGKRRRDRQLRREFVVIENILPAINTRFGSAYLTFTSDSMLALNQTLEKDYPDKILVGWYHTHPKMGVFFSEWDRWLHTYFFPEPWHVALVMEPYSKMGGFFIVKQDGRLDQRQCYGFYELTNHSNHTVVNWSNLIPEAGQLYAQGENA